MTKLLVKVYSNILKQITIAIFSIKYLSLSLI